MPFISDQDAQTTIDVSRGLRLERKGPDGGATGYIGFVLRGPEVDYHFHAKLTDAAVLRGERASSRSRDLVWLVWSGGWLCDPSRSGLRGMISEALLSYKAMFGFTAPDVAYAVHFEEVHEFTHD